MIAIIAILAGLLFSVFARAKASAKQTACASNLRQVGVAVGLYMADYDDMFPYCVDASDKFVPDIWVGQPEWKAKIDAMPLYSDLLQTYAKSKDVLKCPADSGLKTLESLPTSDFVASTSMHGTYGGSYLLRTEIVFRGTTGTTFTNPSAVNVFFDGGGHWHGSNGALEKNDPLMGFKLRGYRYNVLFGDWHVKNRSYDALQEAWLQKL